MVAGLALAGVVWRLWFVLSPLGRVDGDEAVVGLMARRLLEGQAEAFFWGQEYGGSHEAGLVAALLAVGVPGRWAMELVPAGLHVVAAVLVWRIGLRTTGRRAAALAAGLSWAASPALLWHSTKERSFYGAALVLGLGALLAVLRLASVADRPSWRDAAVAGACLGAGWWASPHILHFAVPAGLWLAWVHRGHLRRLAVLLPVVLLSSVLAGLPWIWATVADDWSSLDAASGDRRLFGGPFDVFFRYGLPMVLGLRAPITLGWEFPGARLVYAGLLAGAAVVIAARPRPLRPLLPVVALYPVIFALLPSTYYYGEPRYLAFLWPALALVGGWALADRGIRLQALALVVILAVTANGVLHMTRLEGPPGRPFEDVSPPPVEPLVAALDAEGIDRVFADYWVAYRLGWETEERILGTPLQFVRSPADDREVRAASRTAYVVVAGSCLAELVRADVRLRAPEARIVPAGAWEVILPDRPVLPEDVMSTTC